MLLCYCHVMYEFQSESTPYSLPECQGTPCSKQAPYLKFKWQQRDSIQNHLVCERTLNHLSKLAYLAKWLSVRLRTKWLWVRISLLSLKSLLFTSISHVQEKSKLNEVNHGQKRFSLLVVFLWPIILFNFRWHK